MNIELLTYGVPFVSFIIAAVSAVVTVKVVGEATSDQLGKHVQDDRETHAHFGATQLEILRAIGRLEGKAEEVVRAVEDIRRGPR